MFFGSVSRQTEQDPSPIYSNLYRWGKRERREEIRPAAVSLSYVLSRSLAWVNIYIKSIQTLGLDFLSAIRRVGFI